VSHSEPGQSRHIQEVKPGMTEASRSDQRGQQTAARPRQHLSTDRPTACSDVTAYPVDDELVLYDPRSSQAFVLNPTAAQIWRLCDGSRTIAALAEAMAAAYALAYEEALTDVWECLEHLRHEGLLLTA
jgi:pyrroloquinoline quinone biosynthesis protein D